MIIALTCYNRIYTLRKTMESLQKCYYFSFTPIYFFADGGEFVLNVRSYIQSIKRPIDKIFFQIENLGLKKNTLCAIERTLQDDDMVWLQDDMEFSKDFLEFMLFSFSEYKNDKEIMFVSGYTPVLHHSLYLSPYTSEALGMWKNKFYYIDKVDDLKGYRKFAGDMFYNMLLDAKKKDVISVYLNYSMYKRQGYCLHPNRNKLRHLVTDSINCKAKDAKKLNQELYEGFSKRIDSGNLDLVKRYSPIKRATRWISNLLK